VTETQECRIRKMTLEGKKKEKAFIQISEERGFLNEAKQEHKKRPRVFKKNEAAMLNSGEKNGSHGGGAQTKKTKVES